MLSDKAAADKSLFHPHILNLINKSRFLNRVNPEKEEEEVGWGLSSSFWYLCDITV